jgi:hypothetical protein
MGVAGSVGFVVGILALWVGLMVIIGKWGAWRKAWKARRQTASTGLADTNK